MMEVSAFEMPPEPPIPFAVVPQVQDLVNSRALQRAHTLRALLLYLWEHQGRDLSEFEIATEVLGKGPDFDPKIDATVRVHIARLRQKLRDYYESDGARSAVRIEIPPGGYRVEVQYQAVEEPVVVESPPTLSRRPLYATAAICVVLVAVTGLLGVQNLRLRERLSVVPSPPPIPWFWESYIQERRGIQLIYPAPVFLEWPQERLRVRDVDIDDFAKIEASARIRRLMSLFGRPQLNQRYTVNTDAAAAVKLSKFLARYGVDLKVTSTSNYAQEANTTDHVILLGIPATNPTLSAYIPATGFRFAAGFGAIQPDGPNPDPKLTIRSRHHSGRRVTEPVLLASLPGQNPLTGVLVLAGPNSSALASLLITPSSLDRLRGVWRRQGAPRYFSALVVAESDGETILKTEILDLRKAIVSR